MYHFIANPNARSGQGHALREKIKLKLIAEHIDYQIHFTHHRHHATEIAAELTASGDPVTIVVLGGDGSVDEVICGLQNLSLVTLGYIPIGSGNDFGRGLALPSDTMKALDLVLHSEQTRKINLGVLHSLCLTYLAEKLKKLTSENMVRQKSSSTRKIPKYLKMYLQQQPAG